MKKNKFLFLLLLTSCTRYTVVEKQSNYFDVSLFNRYVNNNLQTIVFRKDIDTHTIKVLRRVYGDFAIKDKNSSFDPTDLSPHVPERRIMFGGKNKKICFFVYEEGGAAIKNNLAVVFREESVNSLFVIGLPPVKDLNEVLAKLESGNYNIYVKKDFYISK